MLLAPFHCQLASNVTRPNAVVGVQARPEHRMTKESYLEAIFRGIEEFYAAASQQLQGAPQDFHQPPGP
jgi:hypothetical protein